MSTEILVAVIGISAIFATGFVDMLKMIFKSYLESRKKKRLNVGYLLEIDSQIYKELELIIDKHKASRVMISRLHNGGYFFGGIPMEKFTATHEAVNEKEVGELIQQEFQNTLLSTYSVSFMKIFHNEYYFIPDVKKLLDVNLKKTLEKRNVESMLYILIKDPKDNQPIAFLSLYYKNKASLKKSDLTDLLLRKDKLASFLTVSFKRER